MNVQACLQSCVGHFFCAYLTELLAPVHREKISLNTISFESAMGLIRNTLDLGVLLSEVCSMATSCM